MSSFSSQTRIGIDGTEAWVISADHIANVLDLVFKNRSGEIWLFNNDLHFFKRPDLFNSVYVEKIVRDLGSRITVVKVFVEDQCEDEVLTQRCRWLEERFKYLSNFIKRNALKSFPRFLFARMSILRQHHDFKRLFDPSGIPLRHTSVFYLHGQSLSWSKQHGIALIRPTEFPFANRDFPLALSWHLSDSLILSSTHRKDFDSCFARKELFTQVFPRPKDPKPTVTRLQMHKQPFEGLAFGEPADILIIAPADDEMSYLRKIFGPRLHDVVEPGIQNAYCLITQSGRSVVCAKVGEGNTAASVATARLLNVFQPKHVILLGVAGAVGDRGRHQWAIGDVVIGQSVIDYEWGEVQDSKTDATWIFTPKMDIRTDWGGEHSDRFLYGKACKAANDRWRLSSKTIKSEVLQEFDKPQRPQAATILDEHLVRSSLAHTGIIGSGSKLVASLRYVQAVADKKCTGINAFETEAAGVSYACEEHARTDCLIIRGIMDLADGKTRDSKIRKVLRHAAKVACGRFVSHLIDQL